MIVDTETPDDVAEQYGPELGSLWQQHERRIESVPFPEWTVEELQEAQR